MYKRLGWAFRRHLMLSMGIEPFDVSYLHKALSVGGLVGAWLQGEGAGAISYDSSGHGYNGQYTATLHGQPSVPGMGTLSMGYDGAASFNNIYSAGLAGDNELLNGGFETPGGGGADIWANFVETAGDGALANEVGIVHQGVDSCKQTSGLTSNTGVAQAIVSVPGDGKRERFWSYGDGVNAGRYAVYDVTNGAYIIPITSTGVTAAAWGMVAVEYTVPAGCVSVRIDYLCPPVNGGICYFDACEVRPKDAFCGDQGTIIVPAQVANVGVWTDTVVRYIISIQVDANNRINIRNRGTSSVMDCSYVSGGVSKTVSVNVFNSVAYIFNGLTWSIADDEFIFYIDGLQVGLTQNGLGTWLGDLLNILVTIGAVSTVPNNVWSGNIGPALLFSETKSPAEMLYLGTV